MIQTRRTRHYRPVPRPFRRQRLLIIGCGDIGQRLVRQLHHGWQVIGVARSQETLERIRAAGAMAVSADAPTRAHRYAPDAAAPDTTHTPAGALHQPHQRLARWATHVLHAAPPASREGEVTDRLTQGWLRALAQARGHRSGSTSPTARHRLQRHVGTRSRAALAVPAPATRSRTRRGHASGQAPRFVYLSTTGVYGDRGGAFTRESDAPRPQTDRARRRVDAERQVRFGTRRFDSVRPGNARVGGPGSDEPSPGSTGLGSGRHHRRLRQPPLSALVLRVPGIYAADRLPVERLRQRVPALVPADDVITNHIHADDLARIAHTALLRGPRQRVINAVDDSRMTLGDYLDQVADRLGLPRPPRHTRTELAQTLSKVRMSFMRESRQLDTRRLKRELRVRLRWPTVGDFLASAAPDKALRTDSALP